MTNDGQLEPRDIYLGEKIDRVAERMVDGFDRLVDRLSESTGRLHARLDDDLPERMRQVMEQAVAALVPPPAPWWQKFPANMLVALAGLFVFMLGLGGVAAWGILPDGMLERLIEVAASYVETGGVVGEAVASPITP